jgi:hypothetical protein
MLADWTASGGGGGHRGGLVHLVVNTAHVADVAAGVGDNNLGRKLPLLVQIRGCNLFLLSC